MRPRPFSRPTAGWIAYVSDDTGRSEIYVQSFPEPGERTLISSGGGTEPVWARSGRELFYRSGDHLMAVPVDGSGERFVAAEPARLFDLVFGRRD